MSADPVESVILCEGYHDRAFWSGFLESAGWRDARPLRGGRLGSAVDPFGKSVGGGDYAFLSPTGAFLRIRPCHGVSRVLTQMGTRLKQRSTEAVDHLIVNLDSDAGEEDLDVAARENVARAVRSRIRSQIPAMVETDDGDVLLDEGRTRISIVLWSTPDRPSSDLPEKQTLERLVCAALRDAHPERAQSVATWLAARPSPPAPGPKSYKSLSWAHMAGWYPEHGCDDFFRLVCRAGEPAAIKLRERLFALLPESVKTRLFVQPVMDR